VCSSISNGRLITYSETQQKAGLPDARVSDQQEFEQVIAERERRFRL